jgi:hypothetical protein
MGACLGGQAASPADEAAAKRSKELDAKAAADFRKDQVSTLFVTATTALIATHTPIPHSVLSYSMAVS